jgi:hypothetical protein
MSKFYVGQLVRIVDYRYPGYVDGDPTLVGKVATITAKDHDSLVHRRWFLDLPSNRENRAVCPIEQILEPVYDGDVPVAWSECAWRPLELVKV